SYPYDWVDFNSVSATASNYTASGTQYNKFGLTNDFEVILGGPGGGSQADLFAADANMSLQYWNSSTGSFRSVPAAYSYGGETGETVTGANVKWTTNATTGQPFGVVTGGAGFLYGLWNATTPSGMGTLNVHLTPSNEFIFLAINRTGNFSYEGEPYWAPQELNNGTFSLAPGAYNITVELAGYDPEQGSFTLNAGQTVTFSGAMTANSALGIYTPLYVWNNDQFAGISTSGNGTPGNPYQIFNTQPYLMPSVFGFFNDYTFPVYYSVFFWNTNASVVLSNMPAMTTSMPYLYFPTTNDLGYLLEGTSNVALVNSTQISGWFTSNVDNSFAANGAPFNGNYYGTFSVQLWNATKTLIANDTFRTQAAGLGLQGGTNNTVWGNTFVMVPEPAFSSVVTGAGIAPLNLSLGLQATESGDVIYNNYFATTTTASAPPFNLYTGAIQSNLEKWNITPTPASTVNYATDFPWFPLTGTIIHNGTQGGNFWWDYGTTSNPIGTRPYKEYNTTLGVDQIYYGGDDFPLIETNYTVT
ncbi:thermopsin precursor related protein, partial [mine drainage metagenome]